MEQPDCVEIHTELCQLLAAVLPVESQSRNAINVENVFGLSCGRFTGERIKEIVKWLKIRLPMRFKDVKLNGKNKETLQMICFAMFSELTLDIKEKRITLNHLESSVPLRPPPVTVASVAATIVTNSTNNSKFNRSMLTAQYLEDEDCDIVYPTTNITSSLSSATTTNDQSAEATINEIKELFRRYNPQKIGEVEELLKKYAPNELLQKIKAKYAKNDSNAPQVNAQWGVSSSSLMRTATATTTNVANTNIYTTPSPTVANNKNKKQKIQHMNQPNNHRYFPIINSAKKIQVFNTLKAQPGITDTEIIDAFRALCTSANDDDIDETSILMIIVSKRATDEEKLIQAEIVRQIEETDRIIMASESDQFKLEERKRNRLHSLKHDCTVDLSDAPEFKQSVLLGFQHDTLRDKLPAVNTGSKSLGVIAKSVCINACKKGISCVCDPTLRKLRNSITSFLLVEADAYKYWKESCLHYLCAAAQRIDSKCNQIIASPFDLNSQIVFIDVINGEYEQLCKILYKIQKVAHAIPKAFRKADPFYGCKKSRGSLTLDEDGIELVDEGSGSSSSEEEKEENYILSDDD